jgi:hypothetical protein
MPCGSLPIGNGSHFACRGIECIDNVVVTARENQFATTLRVAKSITETLPYQIRFFSSTSTKADAGENHCNFVVPFRGN